MFLTFVNFSGRGPPKLTSMSEGGAAGYYFTLQFTLVIQKLVLNTYIKFYTGFYRLALRLFINSKSKCYFVNISTLELINIYEVKT